MRTSRLSAIALATALLAAPAGAADVTGTWRLVEQRYAGGDEQARAGGANLADLDRPVLLQLVADGPVLRGTVRAGTQGEAHPWPAFAADGGPLPVEILRVEGRPGGDRVEARYLVRPSPTDDLRLEVVEAYDLADDGRTLAGRLTVRFAGDAGERGGFVLHRRFERVTP